MLVLIGIHAEQRERVEHEGALQSPHAESHQRPFMTILFLLCPAPALHKKYPLRMLFVRKTGLFDLEKPSKRDQKVLIDR